MDKPAPAEFDAELAELIRIKAHKLVGHYGFTVSDVDDLCQHLYLQTFEAMGRHDPKRAKRRTFAEHLVTSKIATIIEGRKARKRDWRKQRQLDDKVESTLIDHADSPEDRDRAIDVRDSVLRMPREMQKWAKWFAELTEAEIIRAKRVTRGKVRVMHHRITEHLRKDGLVP